MEVIRAKRAGACYGVQRALDMADEVIADGGRAYTCLLYTSRWV